MNLEIRDSSTPLRFAWNDKALGRLSSCSERSDALSNDEIRMTNEIRMTKSETLEIWRGSCRSFELRASFDLRHSSIVIL
jgi:hypothetical protein